MMIVTLVKEVSDVDGVVIALNAILAMVCIAALFIVWWLIKRILK